MSVYLGLDASTQSLTSTLIEVDDDRRSVIAEESITYDAALPAYGTQHGVIRGSDPQRVGAPPLMWVEALDLVMARLSAGHPRAMANLTAVSGSAQQHGSVYLNAAGLRRLQHLDSGQSLAGQMTDGFARSLSPVWMDSSTTVECREIEAAVGGAAA